MHMVAIEQNLSDIQCGVQPDPKAEIVGLYEQENALHEALF